MKSTLPLRRSITFWSGVLVVVFILWAWWDSYNYRSVAGGHSYSIAQSVGTIGVTHDTETWKGTGFRGYREPGMMRVAFEWLPEPFFLRGREDYLPQPLPLQAETMREQSERVWADRSRGSWLLGIPHWLVLLGFALVWVGMLFWRLRRRRKTDLEL